MSYVLLTGTNFACGACGGLMYHGATEEKEPRPYIYCNFARCEERGKKYEVPKIAVRQFDEAKPA